MKSSLPIRLDGKEPVVGFVSRRTVEELREGSMEPLTSVPLRPSTVLMLQTVKTNPVDRLQSSVRAQFQVTVPGIQH